MNLYETYRGPVDLTAEYRAVGNGREVRFVRQAGESVDGTARRLHPGVVYTERVYDPAPRT